MTHLKYLKYEGAGKVWSSETTVTWSANISFTSTASGLHVQLHPGQIVPDFRSTHINHGAPGREAQVQELEQLKAKFPDLIGFAIPLRELKNDLKGMWAGVQVHAHELCVAYPVFNRRGDLLLELTVRGAHVESVSSANGSARKTINGKSSVLSLNGSATPVGMNGNGNATSER